MQSWGKRFVVASVIATISCGALHAADKPKAMFVEQTYVVAPKQIDHLRLAKTSYNPADRFSGVNASYKSERAPEATMNLFVYPAGRSPQKDAIEEGMKEFIPAFSAAQKRGTYKSAEIESITSFTLDEVAKPREKSANDLDNAILDALDGEAIEGRKIKLDIRLPDDTRMRSFGYLFYKNLNYFKVRISAPYVDTDAVNFEKFADASARLMVSAAGALNVGSCAEKSISLDEKTSPDQMAVEISVQTVRLENERCTFKLEPDMLSKEARTATIEKIEFKPGDWR